MLRMFTFVSMSDKFINEVFSLTMNISLYLCEILKTYLAPKLQHCTFVKYSRCVIREHTSLSSEGEGSAVSVIINLIFLQGLDWCCLVYLVILRQDITYC